VRSEIPQLQVVTAIGDADSEDYVAQLLFSQGWNIVFRAFDMRSLLDFFNSRPPELRTVLVFRNDLPDFDPQLIDHFISPSLTIISLNEIQMNAHSVMLHIRTQLRLPLIVSQSKKINVVSQPVKLDSVIITGTTGAPGRSTIALNLALDTGLSLFDFDFRSPSLKYFVERSDLDIPILNLADEKPREYQPNESAILDIGPLPPLDEMVNDRRWQASFLNSAFESGTKLVYVAKASGLSLLRLQKFMEDFPILLRKIPIIYVFNLAGNSREERALERSFLKIVGGESSVIIPEDIRIANPSKSSNKVIGKLSALVQ
jgi:hypothetical protein